MFASLVIEYDCIADLVIAELLKSRIFAVHKDWNIGFEDSADAVGIIVAEMTAAVLSLLGRGESMREGCPTEDKCSKIETYVAAQMDCSGVGEPVMAHLMRVDYMDRMWFAARSGRAYYDFDWG